jgi:two-component system, chemotaxis family, protein-glutamate methylesterase/glutaminase
VHRLRNVHSDLSKVFVQKKAFKLHEPEDKELIIRGNVYLAPANYHLLFEGKESFCLDYSEPIWYSRPSIDVTFSSAAHAFGKNTLAILLTGANADGAEGCHTVLKNGGTVLVQNPEESAFDAMPKAAIERNKNCIVCSIEEIIEKTQSFINKIP